MQYAFVLGTNPLISAAEIRAALLNRKIQHEILALSGSVLIIDTKTIIKYPQTLLDALGGTIKIVEIHTRFTAGTHDKRLAVLDEQLATILQPLTDSHEQGKKLTIGISSYGNFLTNRDVAQVGMKAKKYFRELQTPVRFVRGQEKTTLDAGSIIKNELIGGHGNGGEICLFPIKHEIFVGITKAIQDIDFYTVRDMDRPRRDMKIGMLPPKLAQILLNLGGSTPHAHILDPFCGVGTVIQEGLLAGSVMTGADRDPHAIQHTEKNVRWFETILRAREIPYETPKLVVSDARDLLKKFAKNTFDGIATESYLGPLVESIPTHSQIEQMAVHMESMLARAFEEFHEILKPNGLVAITFPFYRSQSKESIFVMSSDFIDKIKNLGYDVVCYIPPELIANPQLKQHVERRNSLLYAREDQIVGREIFVFRKK